ncbi:MAG: hypothetical protein V2J07_03130 [Anaerolineae bacterium]|jgi:hypothetical protein|nr:hypothetical protein [Anaerolineae bacterium]
MMDQLSPILETLLSALPVAIMVIIFGFYMAGLYWREDTKRKLNEYLKNIREHDIAIRKYSGLMGKFNEFEDKPPFSNQFDTILKKLAELHSNRDREMKLYSHLRGEMDDHNKRSLKNRFLAPWHWLQTHQKLNSLDHLDMIVTTNVDAVSIDVHQLMHIQNEIARKIAVGWQEIQELEHNIQNLIQHGVRGDAVTPYKHIHTRLRQRFSNIPAYLLTPSQSPLASDDTLKHIAAAYTILEESRPVLEEPLIKTRLWLEQTELLPQAIDQVENNISALKDKVLMTSESIDLTAFYEEIKEAHLAVDYAQGFSQHIEPSQLEAQLESLTHQYEKLNQSIEEINTADAVLQTYLGYRESLANQWYAIETIVPQLRENPILPIIFSSTNEELEFHSASLRRLLDLREPHTINQFRQETPLLQEKIGKIQALQTDLQTMQTTQAELMALIRRLQWPKLSVWVQKTRDARSRLTDFAIENYQLPPNWQQLDLDTEIDDIAKQARENLPALNQPVHEENLLEMWQTAQNIDKMVMIIQDGLNNQLQQRKALIEQEKSAIEHHTLILNQVNLLKDIQLEREQLQKIRFFFRQLEDLKQSLMNRNESSMAEKVTRLNELETDIRANLDEWLQNTRESVSTLSQKLENLIEELTAYAELSDEIFTEIRAFLDDKQPDPQTGEHELATAMEQYIITKDREEQANLFLNQMQPLHAEIMQAVSAYQQLLNTFKDGLTAAGEFVDFSNSWNQNVLNLDMVQKQGQQLEQDMHNFLKSSHHSQNLIRKMKQYAARFEEQFEKLNGLVNQIQQEQAEQQEAENGLQAVMYQWKQVAQQWQEDKIVAENVDNLLKRYHNRARDAQTSYERGRIRFSSFISTLNSLKKHLSFEVITNEENRSIEISGKEYI